VLGGGGVAGTGWELGLPAALTAATVRSLIAVITLNEQVRALQGEVEENVRRHPDAEIYLS
jgi:hypothetical protein